MQTTRHDKSIDSRVGAILHECPLSVNTLRRSLNLLLEAHRCAEALSVPARQLAVGVSELRRSQVSEAAVRWLSAKGYVLHFVDVAGTGEAATKADEGALMVFQSNSCFVLSEAGVALAREILDRWERPETDYIERPNSAAGRLPAWDVATRELRVGNLLVKKFRQPAAAQERILAAFQEEAWPRSIDDPLPPKPGISPHQRLHDTIQRLNQRQTNRLIIFSGDGTGERVLWRWTSDSA